MTTGHATILIVEDADAVRLALERVLRAVGYRVLAAADGSEALRLAEQHGEGIDLVLTDVVMPQMSGADLAKRLQARHPTLKVLFTSGHTHGAMVHQGMLEPGTRFIGKPFSVADLARTIRTILDEVPG